MMAIPPGLRAQCIFAAIMMSPQGFKRSPYLPNPACSIEEKDTKASKGSREPFMKPSLNSALVKVVTFGCSDVILPYSIVVTCRAPIPSKIDSSQGDLLPTTATCFPLQYFSAYALN